MESHPNPTTPNGGPGRIAAEHILIMHCLRDDSVLGQEGCTVRATSTGDAGLQQWALSIEHYELPFDLRSGSLLSSQTPRRLALVPAPGGRTGLVHSSYLKEDTRGRPHSFISHVLVYPRLDPRAAAEAWGADDWPTDEYGRGASKTLSVFDGVPRGELVGEKTLERFLAADGAASTDQSLARVAFPARLESDPEARRRWLRAMINAYLKCIEPEATRNRVCVLAEPGTVALLVYAIARLLPHQLVGSFSFSTYEPPHTSLRENKLYRIVGSYTRAGLDGNDLESLRRRSYVVDTFRPIPAAELGAVGAWPLEPLLDAAAAGDWPTVERIRELWATDPQVVPGATPPVLAAALRLRPLATALADGTITPEGLLELRSNPAGDALLHQPALRDRAWAVLRPIWSRPDVVQAFHAMLVERSEEILEAARRKAASGTHRGLREDWSALKQVLGPGRRQEALATLLQSAGQATASGSLRAEDRSDLLREWLETMGPAAPMTDGLRWLLAAGDGPALSRLLTGPPRPHPRHAGLALCLALAGANTERWQAEPEVLKEAGEEPFAAFLTELSDFAGRKAVYQRLAPAVNWLVPRVLGLPAKAAPPTAFESLLSAHGAANPDWQDFWLGGKHLVAILERIGHGSKLGRKIWAGLIGRFNAGNFDGPERTAELWTLLDALHRFPEGPTPEDRARLDAWHVLNLLINDPRQVPATPEAVSRACAVSGVTPQAVTDRGYHRRIAPVPEDDVARKAQAELFAAMLVRLYGSPQAALPVAIVAANAITDGRRVLLKEDLFRAVVPEAERDALYARHQHDLWEISYVPSAKPAATTKAARQQAARSRFRDQLIAGAVGAGMAVAVLGVLYVLEVFNQGAPLEARPKPDQDIARLKEENSGLTETTKVLQKENESLKEQLDLAETEAAKQKTAAEKAIAEKVAAEKVAAKKAAADQTTETPNGPPGEQAASKQLVLESTGRRSPKSPNESPGSSTPAGPQESPDKRDYLDVRTDIAEQKSLPPADRFDFAFVTNRLTKRPVLATLSNFPKDKLKSGRFIFFSFNIDDEGKLNWSGQLLEKPYSPAVAMATNYAQQVMMFGEDSANDRQIMLSLDDKAEWDPRSLAARGQVWGWPGKRLLSHVNIHPILAVEGSSLDTAMHAFAVRPSPAPDRVVVIHSKGSGIIRDFEASRVQNLLMPPNAPIRHLGFFPDGSRLLVSYEGNSNLVVLDLGPKVQATDQVECTPLEHDGPVLGWDFNADNTMLVTLDASNTVTFWDVTAGKPKVVDKVPKMLPRRSTCIAHGRNKGARHQLLATGDGNGAVTLWRYEYATERPGQKGAGLEMIKPLSCGANPVRKIAFSADGQVLAALAGAPPKKPSEPYGGIIRLWPCPKP